ncbi:reprolysin-like metallopeptidase [Chryseobacterium sp. CT-SW4]|uniref:reprolysin-like metallopeptidase n=1 Tax=Chryseobacterium sp. SW-1 TaxID=3157343 RepID=UPI003B01742D
MKKLLTTLVCTLMGGAVFGQWTPTTPVAPKRGAEMKITNVRGYYKLDLNKIREQLKDAQETGPNAQSVEISLPTLSGKIERFKVYSFPVLVKSLEDRYQLGSYVGVGVDDPSKYLRFSVSPNDFQSMIIKGGEYEFIEPQNTDKTVYGVHAKTRPTEGKSFVCSTQESPAAVQDIQDLYKKGSSFTNQPSDFSKSSDKKYRTMRLVMSVTGEYTQYHGGTVAGAVAAINATMTRVNGVFEKDFALHLIVQDYPNVIYTNAATDPYSNANTGAAGAWNLELQNTLTANVGNANYDIGHLFGASGGGGNAGCIGCVCVNPTTAVPEGKGSGYTSPADGIPQGDNFDIDYVAHEMGHQLGANHTFSHNLEGSGVNVEPGSGSTIMGYAGITGTNTDVQAHSDAYFHIASIKQVQTNLVAKTCDVETTITNNPPVIAALPTYNIPKGTAFVLTASATDAENNPMTYTWEEVDDAIVSTNKNNLGTTTSGASFRSVVPSTSPVRYFPKLSSVLNGVLNNSANTWESVSMVPRTTKFAVTVRDNNPTANQQQTQYAEQTIVVGNDGPFRLATQYAQANTPTPIEWLVANTTAAPYNVANVKIDYTTDNGTTWTVLSASTPNDGSENFTFPFSLNGQTIKVRVSSIGNVFYTIGSVALTTISACSSTAPTNVVVSSITSSSASVSWVPYTGATYIVRYKKVSETTWQEIPTTIPAVNLTNLVDGTTYQVQVAAVCSGVTGSYSASVNFTTTAISYCTASVLSSAYEYISNVTVANINNTSGASTYTNYATSTALQVNLVKGNTYPMSISVGSPDDYDVAAVFIDYNKNGTFEDSERVLSFPTVATATSLFTGSFTVPTSAVENQPLRMRVVLFYAGADNLGLAIPSAYACGLNFYYGEIEDYNVVVTSALSTRDVTAADSGIQLYPNPATDVLNVTKVSDKATYKIYSAAGQLVESGNVSDGKINVNSLVKGAYVITIDEKGEDLFRSKFIKK